MTIVNILTIISFIFTWFSANRVMKLGRDQKKDDMMIWMHISIFASVITTLFILAHLFI